MTQCIIFRLPWQLFVRIMCSPYTFFVRINVLICFAKRALIMYRLATSPSLHPHIFTILFKVTPNISMPQDFLPTALLAYHVFCQFYSGVLFSLLLFLVNSVAYLRFYCGGLQWSCLGRNFRLSINITNCMIPFVI